MCTKPKLPGLNPDIIQCNEPETWGLTYDDGPNCSHSELLHFFLLCMLGLNFLLMNLHLDALYDFVRVILRVTRSK
jgi:hypothetical protein